MMDTFKIVWSHNKVYVSGSVETTGAKLAFDVSASTKHEALAAAHSAIGTLVGKVAAAQTDIMSK